MQLWETVDSWENASLLTHQRSLSAHLDNVSQAKGTKAQPVPGLGTLAHNDRLVVVETAGAVSSTTETMERYLAQKGMLLRYTLTDWSLLCG